MRPPHGRRLWALFGVIALAALGAWAMTDRRPVLPPLTLALTDGGTLALQTLRGRPLVIDYWSVDCPVCLEDMPRLAALYPELQRRGVTLLGVNIPQDPPPAIMAMAKRLQVPWPLAMDPRGELAAALRGVHITPTLMIFDRDGRLVTRLHGRLQPQRLLALLDDIQKR